ncbi:MAG: DUF3445 domain-containing protein [Sneathiella sp.]
MRYFPLGSSDFKITMGLQALKNTSWLDVDDNYRADIALKQNLLSKRRDHVFAALPGTEKAQGDILDAVRTELKDCYQDLPVTAPTPSLSPLTEAACLVQEDLVLMQPVDGIFKLTAACVCFPSGWNLTEKIGRSLFDIHAPVPALNTQIGPSIDQFFERLNPRKKVQRFNWGIFDNPALFQPEWARQQQADKKPVSAETIGQKLFFRVERQTLQRLPSAKDTLFTIRIFNTSLDDVTKNPARAGILLCSLRTMPEAMRHYKAVARYKALLFEYLAGRSA